MSSLGVSYHSGHETLVAVWQDEVLIVRHFNTVHRRVVVADSFVKGSDPLLGHDDAIDTVQAVFPCFGEHSFTTVYSEKDVRFTFKDDTKIKISH